MEAVPATSGVRRTVRLAAALVVGQVLLVAVIGWVTFTQAGQHSGRDTPAVEQLAAPPAVIPPPAVPAPTRSATPGPGAGTSTAGHPRDRTTDPDRPAAARASSSSRPPAAGPVLPPLPPPVATPGSGPETAPLTLVPTSDSPAAVTPTPTASSSPPVLAGQACTEMYTLAQAADGQMVQCLPTRSHQLRWKIV